MENNPGRCIIHDKDELQHIVLNATLCLYNIVKELCCKVENSAEYEVSAKQYLIEIEKAVK